MEPNTVEWERRYIRRVMDEGKERSSGWRGNGRRARIEIKVESRGRSGETEARTEETMMGGKGVKENMG